MCSELVVNKMAFAVGRRQEVGAKKEYTEQQIQREGATVAPNIRQVRMDLKLGASASELLRPSGDAQVLCRWSVTSPLSLSFRRPSAKISALFLLWTTFVKIVLEN